MEKVGEIDVIFKQSVVTSENHGLYPGYKQGTTVFQRGSILKDGALSLPCDILMERDVPVKLRDGVTIYTDVYRPPKAKQPLPAIISYAGFGKGGGINRMATDRAPWRNGIPQWTVSSLEKFEALDPAYWCLHGYVLVHPDTRGTWMSEGDTYSNSTLDGRDGYDLIEWVASQSWSNKCVTMAGNSYLAQSQWWIGAERPPHLTCLAPWEGWNDLYNDTAQRGGIPDPDFQQELMDFCFPGRGRTEDLATMTKTYPTWNDYWEDRRARVDKIDVPLYVVASWTNMLHTRGTFRGFIESGSSQKWLRVHNSHEWPDLYYPQNTEDLRRFFDHFMKGVSNGWEFTPKVRLSILNPGHQDIVNRPESAFPLQRQQSVPLFLDTADTSLKWNTPIQDESHIDFDARDEVVRFQYSFEEKTEVTGYSKLKLWVQVKGHNDADIFVKYSKLDAQGQLLEALCIDVAYLQDDPEQVTRKLFDKKAAGDKNIGVFFAEGAHGRLRVSHRELDPSRSTPHRPSYTHKNLQPLQGEEEIVEIEIELWPHGMIWEAQEKLQLSVAGFNLRPELRPQLPPCPTQNKGKISIYTGGKYDSHLLLPVIPESRS